MSIAKKGGYSGGGPASEMGPPANLPSATIKPFREHTTTKDCWCQPEVEAVPGPAKFRHCGRGICAAEEGHAGTCDEASGWVEEPESPDSPYVAAMRRVESRRGLIADVDLPAEYAKAAASVTRDLLADLDYAKADARHYAQKWRSAEDELALAYQRERAAKEDAATHAEREGVQEARAREFARQAREGGRLRRRIRSLVNAPEGWHAYNAPNSQGEMVQHHVAFTTTDTLRATLEDAHAHGLSCLCSPCADCASEEGTR